MDPKHLQRRLETLRLYMWLRDNAQILTDPPPLPAPVAPKPKRRRRAFRLPPGEVAEVNRRLREVWAERPASDP